MNKLRSFSLRVRYLLLVASAVGTACIFLAVLITIALNQDSYRNRAGPFLSLLAIIPGFIVLTWLAERVRVQIESVAADPGRCPTCGYDLRATPDRCPECGTVPEARPATAA